MLKNMILTTMLLAGLASPVIASELKIEGAWARLTPPVADNSAAYMTLNNDSNSDVRITSVACDVARQADLHGMRMQNGRMQMYPLGPVTIPAHGQLQFAPGGNHVMLMGLTHPLKKDEIIHLTLHYGDGSSQTVAMPVRDMRGNGMGNMHHGGMH